MKRVFKVVMFVLIGQAATLCLSGCTPEMAAAFSKTVTFRNWDIYKTDVKYWKYKDGRRVQSPYSPSMFPAHIADDNSYVWFRIDFGDIYAGLTGIRMEHFSEDLTSLKKFIQWANAPYEEREASKDALSKSERYEDLGYRVENDIDTKEPLLIITPRYQVIPPYIVFAINQEEAIKVVLFAVTVKLEWEKEHNKRLK